MSSWPSRSRGSDKAAVFCGKSNVESYRVTEDTGCCFLVKLHLPQRCHQWEMRCGDLRGWLENIITSQLWDTNCLWLLVIHSVTAVRNLFPYYLLCGHGTRCHPRGKICFANSPSSAPQLQLWSSGGAADGSKVLQPEPRHRADAGISVGRRNDLLCKPLFISDNMRSGYFGINGRSRWRGLIDVDSHTFWIACSSHGPVTGLIYGRVMGI